MDRPVRPPFEPVSGTPDLPRMEEEILKLWEERDVFQKTIERPAPKGTFVFYEGPPTANNVPHPGHVLTRVVKDIFPRHRTMKGYRVLRKAGWDTHGLPVEIAIEKALGLQGKQEIEAYGIEAFNRQCYENVQKYEREWRRLSNRIGFWLDYDDAYFTYTNKYIESVWWLLARLFDQGLLYEGHKVLPYCPLCGTTHSSHEVAQNYRDVSDPSVTARFRLLPGQTLTGEDGRTFTTDGQTFVLAWTTTPWTLPSNVGLAVHPDSMYRLVESVARPGHHYILADGLTEAVEEVAEKGDEERLSGRSLDLRNAREVLRMTGSALQDLRYERLYDWAGETEQVGWRVVTADYVTLDSGTGVVHIAPAFGEDDYHTSRRHVLPFVCALDAHGRFRPEMALLAGQWFKDADPNVITDLKRRGLLFRSQKVEHPYPYCWRHDTPLHYFATSSWFVKTTAVRDQLVANNQQINWQPEHVKDGRFGNWLEGVVDWALSRKRYWGTPLPIWRCADCGATEAVNSYARLHARMGQPLPPDPYDTHQFNPHRPYVDGFVLPCERCGGEMRRVSEVIDCWFDSGAMPFAQYHYPFENAELIDGPEGESQFPADFISEAIDQTRGWFYTLHAISTLIKGRPAYKNCLVLGHVLDGEGQKMSKSKGNVLDPWDVIQQFGADAFRWHFIRNMAAGQPARFSVPLVRESVKEFLIPLWNAVSFFTIYANIDGWTPTARRVALADRTALDRWILSRLYTLALTVDAELTAYHFLDASRALEAFLGELNNWYIRRSRRRFWSDAAAQEKESAYQTLHEVLTTLARLMAPLLPYTAESLYQRLERPFASAEAADSVHLCAWPEVDASYADPELEAAMKEVLRATSLGLAARNKSNLKVRQPLARMSLVTLDADLPRRIGPFEDLIRDEVNVEALDWATDRRAYVEYRCTPNFRALGPRFGKAIPQVKEAVLAADPARLVSELESLGHAAVEIGGVAHTFSAEELQVSILQKEGTVTANDDALLVALDTTVTPELRAKGLAREALNRIQTMRKDADLAYTDRIRVVWAAEGELAAAIEAHQGTIGEETLAVELERGAPSRQALGFSDEAVDGLAFEVSISRVGG